MLFGFVKEANMLISRVAGISRVARVREKENGKNQHSDNSNINNNDDYDDNNNDRLSLAETLSSKSMLIFKNYY